MGAAQCEADTIASDWLFLSSSLVVKGSSSRLSSPPTDLALLKPDFLNLFLENIEMDFLQGENESKLIASQGIWKKNENVFFLKDISKFSLLAL